MKRGIVILFSLLHTPTMEFYVSNKIFHTPCNNELFLNFALSARNTEES